MSEVEVYIVSDANDLPVQVHWTAAEAWKHCALIGGYVHTATLAPLSEAVDSYFRYRKLTDPDVLDAFLFLTSEVGEMADALVERRAEQASSGWVRNHPDQKHKSPEKEGGDILMMLVKTMQKLGYDPLQQMFSKWKEKGWK